MGRAPVFTRKNAARKRANLRFRGRNQKARKSTINRTSRSIANAGYQRSEAIVNSFGEETREWCVQKSWEENLRRKGQDGLGAKRAKSTVASQQAKPVFFDGCFRRYTNAQSGQCLDGSDATRHGSHADTRESFLSSESTFPTKTRGSSFFSKLGRFPGVIYSQLRTGDGFSPRSLNGSPHTVQDSDLVFLATIALSRHWTVPG